MSVTVKPALRPKADKTVIYLKKNDIIKTVSTMKIIRKYLKTFDKYWERTKIIL